VAKKRRKPATKKSDIVGSADKALPIAILALDKKFDEAVEVCLSHGRASASLLQRHLGLGYSRATKICDQMEALGLVGEDRGLGRSILCGQTGWQEHKRTRRFQLASDKVHCAKWDSLTQKNLPKRARYNLPG